MKKLKMKAYVAPQITLFLIKMEDDVAAGSAMIRSGSSDNYSPGVTDWDEDSAGTSNQRIDL